MNDHLQCFEFCRALEWFVPVNSFVEHHAKGEDVASCVEWFARSLLRRHVCNSADDDPRTCSANGGFIVAQLCQLGEAKVCKLCITVLGYKNVVGLDIAVQDPRF